jgi:hypothetical protein
LTYFKRSRRPVNIQHKKKSFTAAKIRCRQRLHPPISGTASSTAMTRVSVLEMIGAVSASVQHIPVSREILDFVMAIPGKR